jgi:hypothetical protein
MSIHTSALDFWFAGDYGAGQNSGHMAICIILQDLPALVGGRRILLQWHILIVLLQPETVAESVLASLSEPFNLAMQEAKARRC